MKKKYYSSLFIFAAALLGAAASGVFVIEPAFPQSLETQEKVKLDVPFEPSAEDVVEEMLKIASVAKDDLVYDLGCGDGRVIIAAAQKVGARGVGVDLDPKRIEESLENARKAGVSERVKFFQQDLFATDIHDATVVMLYLWPEVNLRLRPKLLADLKPGTRVVSHSHNMGTWEADRMVTAQNGHRVYFWAIPANVSGKWEWDQPGGKDNRHWVLTLRQEYQKIRGTLQEKTRVIPLKNLQLKGEGIQFTVEKTGKGNIYFKGRVQNHSLEGVTEEASAGTRTWKATRDPSTATRLE